MLLLDSLTWQSFNQKGNVRGEKRYENTGELSTLVALNTFCAVISSQGEERCTQREVTMRSFTAVQGPSALCAQC